MPELGSLGSVRGAFSNERPYREDIERAASATRRDVRFRLNRPLPVPAAAEQPCPVTVIAVGTQQRRGRVWKRPEILVLAISPWSKLL